MNAVTHTRTSLKYIESFALTKTTPNSSNIRYVFRVIDTTFAETSVAVQVIIETSRRNTRETRFPANVAQLVEQLTRNEQVAGSSPAVGSLLFDRR